MSVKIETHTKKSHTGQLLVENPEQENHKVRFPDPHAENKQKALAWRWALQLASTDGTNSLLYQSHLCQAVKWIKLFSPLYEKPPTNERRGGVCSGQRYNAGTKVQALTPFSTTEHSPGVLVPCKNHRAGTHWHRMSQTIQQWTGQRPSKNVSIFHEFAWIFQILFVKLAGGHDSWACYQLDLLSSIVYCYRLVYGLLPFWYEILLVQKKLLSAGTIAPRRKSCESPSRESKEEKWEATVSLIIGAVCAWVGGQHRHFSNNCFIKMGGIYASKKSVTNIFLVILGFHLNRW